MSDPVEAAIVSSISAFTEANPGVGEDNHISESGEVVPEPVESQEAEAGATAEGEAAAAGADGKAKPATNEPAAKKDDKTAAAPAEDEFAKEHGVKSKDTLGRENRIPYSAVRDRIVPNAVKKAEATWTETKLKPVQSENEQMKTRLGDVARTEEIIWGNPRLHLEQLARSVPGYADLLAPVLSGAGAGKTAKAATRAVDDDLPSAEDDPEPEPDYEDPTTKAKGWTQDGFKAHQQWTLREATRRAEARLEKKYGPVKDAFDKTQERRARETQLMTKAQERLDQWLDMPGFKENYDEILKVLQEDRDGKLTIKQAYEKVYHPKLRASEDEIRARLLKEMEQTPPSTSSTGRSNAAQSGPAPGEDPVEYAIRAAIAAHTGRV